MDLMAMLGINKNDVLDFFKVLERQAAALERIADVWESVYIPRQEPGNDGSGAAAPALRVRETTR